MFIHEKIDKTNGIKIMKNQLQKVFGLVGVLLFCIIITEGVNRLSFLWANQLPNPLNIVDPQKWFAMITLHHIIQAVVSLLLILIFMKLLKLKWSDFGFQKQGFKEGLRFALIFTFFWIIFQALIGTILIITSQVGVVNPLPTSFYSTLGYQLFQWLLSGTSEEILYRALLIPIIFQALKSLKITSHQKFIVILFTTIAFMVGHIDYTLNPFQIVYFNVLQMLTVIVFGVAYALSFLKYKNVYAIMIMHNILNGFIVLLSFIFYKVF
jgi:uncharacterized protein